MKLTEAEIRSLIKVTKKSKTTLYGQCPKCRKFEFGISLGENHIFGCFRKKKCGWTGNIFSLYKFLGLHFKNEGKNKFQGLELKTIVKKFEAETLEILPEIKMPVGFKRVYRDDYLDSRGFNEHDYQNYICGHTELSLKFKNRIIVGFKDHGQLVAYSGRALGDQKPKYRNSSNGYSSKHVDGLEEFNYPEATLVEGLFDRINVRNCFNQLEIKSRVISCHGAKISDNQIKLIERAGVTRLNLFFDPDVHSVILKSAKNLEHKFDLRLMSLENKELDPGDCDAIQIGESYLNSKNFINFSLSKLPKVQL